MMFISTVSLLGCLLAIHQKGDVGPQRAFHLILISLTTGLIWPAAVIILPYAFYQYVIFGMDEKEKTKEESKKKSYYEG